MKAVEFKINEKACISCGLCAKDCLEGIIELDGFPRINQENKDKFIHCGHCEAICPTASITLDGHDPAELEDMPKAPSRTAVENLVKYRRSIREYKPDPVDGELLTQVINLASFAPTSTNSRQISYIVLNGRQKVEKLLSQTIEIMRKHDFLPQFVQEVINGRDRIFRGAPCLLVAHAPESIPLSSADCATALATLELALPSFGLASCWAGIFTVVCGKEIPPSLQLPEGNRVYGGLMIGKPHSLRIEGCLTEACRKFSGCDLIWIEKVFLRSENENCCSYWQSAQK